MTGGTPNPIRVIEAASNAKAYMAKKIHQAASSNILYKFLKS